MRHIFLILLTLTLLGCTRKELYYGAAQLPGEVIISADWGGAEAIPGGIVAYLYPEGSATKGDYSEPLIEYISNLGSTIPLNYGTYYGVIYNDYTEDVLFRNMDQLQSAEAYLGRSDEAPFATRSPMTKHVGCLESFYKVQIGTFTITEVTKSYSTIVSPKLKTLKLDLIIPVIGGKNIAYARGTLSGVNEAMNLYTGKPNKDNLANVIFDFEITDNTITASIRCFGLMNLNTTNNSEINTAVLNNLEIAFILKDGSQIIGEHIFDITDQIKEVVPAENNGVYEDILIILDDLGVDIVIPDVAGPSEGFDVTVEDWDERIIIDLD